MKPGAGGVGRAAPHYTGHHPQLENLSEPPRESYLSDGFTEKLITCLGYGRPGHNWASSDAPVLWSASVAG